MRCVREVDVGGLPGRARRKVRYAHDRWVIAELPDGLVAGIDRHHCEASILEVAVKLPGPRVLQDVFLTAFSLDRLPSHSLEELEGLNAGLLLEGRFPVRLLPGEVLSAFGAVFE